MTVIIITIIIFHLIKITGWHISTKFRGSRIESQTYNIILLTYIGIQHTGYKVILVFVRENMAMHPVAHQDTRLGATSYGGSRLLAMGQFNMFPFSSRLFLCWRGPKCIAKLDGRHCQIFPPGSATARAQALLFCSHNCVTSNWKHFKSCGDCHTLVMLTSFLQLFVLSFQWIAIQFHL